MKKKKKKKEKNEKGGAGYLLSWGRYYLGEDGITAHRPRKEVELHVLYRVEVLFPAFLYKMGWVGWVGLEQGPGTIIVFDICIYFL